jgi:protein tyrosine phosphatase
MAGGPPTSVLAAALESLSEKLANGAAACRLEFRQLEELQSRLAAQESFAAAKRAPSSNRYSDVMPYDSNRVRITPPAPTRFGAPRGRSSDYINASPLANPQPGAAVPWRYIAAQGPLSRTCPAFWQMIVERGVRVVVMLTRVTELGVAKCAPYFGERAGGEMRWGGTRVATHEVEELMPHLFRRRLSATPPDAAGGPHHVVHLQYTGELQRAAGVLG